MTRYYFITYIGITNEGTTLCGHTTYHTEEEETLKEIEKKLSKRVKCSNVDILNIQELDKKEF